MASPTIGALRHRMVLEASVSVPDGAGGVLISWQPVADLWGEITTRSGDERVEAGGLAGHLRHRIVVRSGVVIAPAHRLRLGDRIFLIRAVHGDGGAHLTCDCDEISL